MTLDTGARCCNYLSLALACLTLGWAEESFVTGMLIFTGAMLAGVAGAFYLDGRWELSTTRANRLGTAIAVIWLTWLVSRLVWPVDGFLSAIPLPAAIIPYVGPLLMVLVVVKLLRWRTIADTWMVQALGMLEVGLACVFGTDLVFAGLLGAYLAVTLAFFALFFLQRTTTTTRAPREASPLILAVLRRVPGWLGLGLGVGVLLFLAIPRPTQASWNAFGIYLKAQTRSPQLATGHSDVIDLNLTGKIEVDDEVALEIDAEASEGGAAPPDLPDAQRWRSTIVDVYHWGRWSSGPIPQAPPPQAPNDLPVEEPLQNLGPSQFYLTFKLYPRWVGGLFLADPVAFDPQQSERVVAYLGRVDPPPENRYPERRPQPRFIPFQGTILAQAFPYRGQHRYRQVTRWGDNPERSQPFADVLDRYVMRLWEQPVRGLEEWTTDLLERLADQPQYGLTPADLVRRPERPRFGTGVPVPGRDPPVGPPALASAQEVFQPVEGASPESTASATQKNPPSAYLDPAAWEKVSRALCQYLATSPQYGYSLRLRRADPKLDATLDFLRNVKSGHCERFAGALALMLRSQGVPARLVKGFRGCEHIGEGHYLVRNSHAHTWVEALVPQGGRLPPEGTAARMEWLSLDPTPATDASEDSLFTFARLREELERMGLLFWKDYVVNYSREKQESAVSDLWGNVTQLTRWGGRPSPRRTAALPWPVLVGSGLTALVGAFVIWRWRWRRRAVRQGSPVRGEGRSTPPPFLHYTRLLALLEHRGLHPLTGQTPREFAAFARSSLMASVTTAELADVPQRVVELLYRVRYGAEALADSDCRAAQESLARLEQALLRPVARAG